MQISTQGRHFIEQWESCKLFPYICPAGKPTIGYGHVFPQDQFEALEKTGITQAKADAWFAEDLAKATFIVSSKVRVPLSQPQVDALVSFAYNVGPVAFGGSTLLRKLNSRQYRDAADELIRWVHDGKSKVLPGLLRRRKAEREMFLSTLAPRSPINSVQPPLKGKK